MSDNNDYTTSDVVKQQEFKLALLILGCGALLTFAFLIVMLLPPMPDVIRMIAGIAGIIVCSGACVISKRIMNYD